jgi:hypothetical protein
VKFTTHLHEVLWLRMVELYRHFPMRLHGMTLNYLSTGTTLSLQSKKKGTVDVTSTPAASSDID